MSVRVEVVCVNPDGSEQRREVLTVEARELSAAATRGSDEERRLMGCLHQHTSNG